MDREPRHPEVPSPPAPLWAAFDDFVLDEGDARLIRGGCIVSLPPKALAVLCTLVRHGGRLVTKDALLDAVWGHRYVTESVLKSTISQVRAALGDDVKRPRYVETASRHGYRFIATLRADPVPIGQGMVQEGAPFVGRDASLRRLDRAWEDARAGRRRITWVTGEAGIGKTTLIDRWLRSIAPERCARGHCIEPFGAGEPFLPVLEALASMCRSETALPSQLRQIAPTWLLQLPWLHEPGEGAALRALLAGVSQDRMLRELGELLDQVARERPLLLVLEDLHWSDASTVRLIDYLARRRGDAPWGVFGSFRSTELVATDHPLARLRHELRVQGLCEEIVLDPLSERDVADWLRHEWPGTDDDTLATAMHAHTDGLPVFLVSVIADLRDRAVAASVDTDLARQALVLRVPESLGGVIGKRLSGMSPSHQAALRAASVRGQSFSQHCVGAVMTMDAGVCLDILTSLASSSLWIEEAGTARSRDGVLRATFRFRHALYQQAIYAAMSSVERAAAHLRLARDLEARAIDGEAITASEMAMHYERGQSPGDALRWLAEAATVALAHFAPQEATVQADYGLRLLAAQPAPDSFADSELSLRVTHGVASAQRFGVGSAEALADLERARSLSDALPHGPQHTWLMNGLGWTYFSRGDFAQAAGEGASMQKRARQLSDPMLALCAANLLGATHAYSGHLDEAQGWLDRAREMLPHPGIGASSVRTIVDMSTSVHVYRAQVLAHRGFIEAGIADAHAAVARARAIGQPMSLCLALRCLCLLAIRTNDLEAAAVAATELRALALGHSLSQSIGPAHWYHGWVLARAGDYAEGLREVKEGLDGHAQLGMTTGCALAHAYAGEISLWRGDTSTARRALSSGLALAESRGESLDQPQLHRLMERIEVLEGRTVQARAAERRARECAARIGAA